MGAVDPGKAGGSSAVHVQQQGAINLDGAMRDEDVFVVGDEEADEQVLEMSDREAVESTSTPPNTRQSEHDVTYTPRGGDSEEPPCGSPGGYYIRPDDTLLGISLRLGINVSAVRLFSSLGLE